MNIEEILGNPLTGNLTQMGVLVFLIVKDIITGYLKNKLDRKEVEIGTMYEEQLEMRVHIEQQSKENQAILAVQQKTMDMFNNLLQNIKVHPDVKAKGAELATDVSIILTSVAIENAEEFMAEGIAKLREAIGDNPLLQSVVDVGIDMLDDAIEKIPSTVEGMVGQK